MGSGDGRSSHYHHKICLRPLTLIPSQLMKIEAWRPDPMTNDRLRSESGMGVGGADGRG